MSDDWASRTADKYVSKRGGLPAKCNAVESVDLADMAWRECAEIVHRVLRRKAVLEMEGGHDALVAFEKIGKAIGEQAKKKRRIP